MNKKKVYQKTANQTEKWPVKRKRNTGPKKDTTVQDKSQKTKLF